MPYPYDPPEPPQVPQAVGAFPLTAEDLDGSQLIVVIIAGAPAAVTTLADLATFISPQTTSVGVNLKALGTTQATAFQIVDNTSIFTNVAPGTGAVLPDFDADFTGLFGDVVVANGQSNMLLYPYGTGTLNGGTAGAAIIVPQGSVARIYVDAPGEIFVR
jgi:hypothetical protein